MPDQNPNNQNYFSLEPTPVKVPWWKVKKNQLRAGGVFGVAVGVALVSYYAYQTYTLTHIDPEKILQAEQSIAQAEEECLSEENPEACQNIARTSAARATAQTTICTGLTGNVLVDCVGLIASDTGNADGCSVLSEEDAGDCRDAATYTTAKKSKNYATCSNIINEDLKNGCQNMLLQQVIDAGECEKFGIDTTTCEYPAKLEAIITAGKLEGCTQLPADKRGECEDVFYSTDRDKDGLSRGEESRLGTSDDTADTDGDGYTDTQEVESGYDPLK